MKLDVIYNEDCIGERGMCILPNKSIDMILCDMPYGTTACKWDTIIPLKPLWKQYKRLIKDRGAIVLMASQPFTSALVMSNPGWFKYCWVWRKNRPGGIANAKLRPLKISEDICIFSSATTANGSSRNMFYNPQGLISCKRIIRQSTTKETGFKRENLPISFIQENTNYPNNIIFFSVERGFHPTQKPVALFEYLIKTYTNEGDLVLDNCMGSGTTAIACKRLNRHYIGFETSKKYCRIAQQRLETEKTLWDKKEK